MQGLGLGDILKFSKWAPSSQQPAIADIVHVGFSILTTQQWENILGLTHFSV